MCSYFYSIKVAKLYVTCHLIWASISIRNKPLTSIKCFLKELPATLTANTDTDVAG